MNLAYLETFVEVVESGSISEYSKRTGLSLSTVSNRLDRTEEFFDRRLLVRDKEGVRLTEGGEFVLAGVSHVLRHLEAIRENGDGPAPRVALIGGNGSLGYLESVLGRGGRLPRLELEEGLRLVESGGVDVGLVCGEESGEGEEVCPDGAVCLVPAGSRFTERGAVGVEELVSSPLIGVEGPGESVQRRVRELLEEAGVESDDLTHVYYASDPGMQVDLVSRSLGVALTTWVVYELFRERYPGVAAVPLEGVDSRGPAVRAISNNGDVLATLRKLVDR